MSCHAVMFGMRTYCLCATFILTLIVGQPAFSLESTEDIDTNRPSFMFSPLVVPKGSIQAENGTLYQHFQHGGNYYDIAETQIRVGLLKYTEFQIYVPEWVWSRTNGTTVNGASNLNEVGIKQQIPLKRLNLSLIGSLDIPVGNKSVIGTGVQPVFRMPWSYALTPSFYVMGMQSLLVLNSGRDVQYQPDFMLSKTFGSKARTSVFAEYIGFFTHHAPDVQVIHFGLVKKLNRNHQLDTHFGFGLNRTAPAAFVGAGYSFRFDGLPWGGAGK